MKTYLLPENGTFYKANLHCHTTISDGRLTPGQVKDAYKAHGYSAVAFTDHEVLLDHRDLCDDAFVALHGYETAIKSRPAQHTDAFMPVYHLNLLAKKQDNLTQVCFCPEAFTPGNCANYLPFVKYSGPVCRYEYTVPFVNHLIASANAGGFLVSYNHPRWSLQTYPDYAPLQGLHAIEVYNYSTMPHGDRNAIVYEDMVRLGNRVVPVGGDDNHNYAGLAESFGAFTMICAEKLTYDALMQAYEKGDCYASAGPEITGLWAEDGLLTVQCSGGCRVVLSGEGRYVRTEESGDLGRATFPPSGPLGRFWRITVEDERGNCAFSRAYFREEWENA